MKKDQRNLIIGIVIGVVIIGLIFLIYNPSRNEIVCNAPYIQVGDFCCLDENSNGICDSDEQEEEQQQIPEQSEIEKKKELGEICSWDDDCESSYCVHNVCRLSLTYCGDLYCDSGETRNDCSSDCLREIDLFGTSPKAICESYDGWIVAENGNDKIVEYDPENGHILFEYSLGTPKWSIECLRNNNLLVVGFDDEDREYQVQEINHDGNVIKMLNQSDIDCSPDKALVYNNGWLVSCYNIDTSQYKIMEISSYKNIVSTKYVEDVRDIFIKGSLYGYASADTIYLYKGSGFGFQTQAYLDGESIISISVLENGNYLISGSGVKEIDFDTGNIVKSTHQFGGSEYDAEELSNGNWLILTNNKAVEINPKILLLK